MSVHRTLVTLEPPIRDAVREIAKREKVSVSSLCRDLIRQALEIVEDRYFDKLASKREEGFNWHKNGLSHEAVWGKKYK